MQGLKTRCLAYQSELALKLVVGGSNWHIETMLVDICHPEKMTTTLQHTHAHPQGTQYVS